MECSCNLAVMQYSNWSWTATRCNPARSTSRVQLISSSRAVIICSVGLSYGHHKKLKSFRNWFHSKKLPFFKENIDKGMIYQFLTEKSFRLDVFDREFLNI